MICTLAPLLGVVALNFLSSSVPPVTVMVASGFETVARPSFMDELSADFFAMYSSLALSARSERACFAVALTAFFSTFRLWPFMSPRAFSMV